MRKFLKCLLILVIGLLFIHSSAMAEGTVVQGSVIDFNKGAMMVTTFTITSDAGSVPLTAFTEANRNTILGMYIFSVEMHSATDAAFTTIITTNTGSTLFSFAATAATTGHIEVPDNPFPVYDIPKIDVTGLATTEICTVIVTFAR